MYSKVMSLVWECWIQTCLVVIVSCLLSIFAAALMFFSNTTLEIPPSLPIFFLYLGCVFIIFALMFLSSNLSSIQKDIDIGFPKRLFRYPVSTGTLVFVYLCYGIIVLSLPFLIFIGLNPFLPEPATHVWYGLLVSETIFIVVQALAWLGGPARYLFLALFLACIYTVSYLIAELDPVLINSIMFSMIITISVVICYWSVSKDRHGAWINGWQWFRFFSDIFNKRLSGQFKTALHAQTWYELMRAGYIFPVASVIIIILLIGNTLFYNGLFALHLLVPVMFSATGFLAFLSGMLHIAVYSRDWNSVTSGFSLRLPISTQNMAVARTRATIKSLACVMGMLLAVSFAISIYTLWRTGSAEYNIIFIPGKWAVEHNSLPMILAMILADIICFILIYWTLLRRTLLIALIGIILPVIRFFVKDGLFLWAVSVLFIILILCTFAAFWIAKRRDLITTRALIFSACIIPVMAFSLLTFPGFDENLLQPGSPVQIIIFLLGIGILPVVPIAATPLWIDRLRHR